MVWPNVRPAVKGYLIDMCLTAQDWFKDLFDKFRIKRLSKFILYRF